MSASGTRPPSWVAEVDADPVAEIDVGRLLSRGGDPFQVLTQTAAAVPSGRGMVVVAPFDPAPLRQRLAAEGFEAFAEPLSDGRVRVRFLRAGGCAAARQPASAETPAEAPAARHKFRLEADGLHLDVRDLPAPRPMLEVLAVLDGGAHHDALVVHVPQVPVHLITELEDRGWTYEILSDEPGDVVLRLTPEEKP